MCSHSLFLQAWSHMYILYYMYCACLHWKTYTIIHCIIYRLASGNGIIYLMYTVEGSPTWPCDPIMVVRFFLPNWSICIRLCILGLLAWCTCFIGYIATLSIMSSTVQNTILWHLTAAFKPYIICFNSWGTFATL